MDYKMADICANLSIGKSTIYKRLDILKKDIPLENLKNNDYFYYDKSNKLFFTEMGFEFIKNFKNVSCKNNINNNNDNNISVIYQNQIIDMYKQRIEYLENENKRLLDIISIREQRELAKDVKYLNSSENSSIFLKFFDKFRRK